MRRKYASLRVIAVTFRILGIIQIVLVVFGFVGILLLGMSSGAALDELGRQFGAGPSILGILGGTVSALFISLPLLILGILVGLGLFAAGDSIYVLLDMEENTRGTLFFLQQNLPRPPAYTFGTPPVATTFPPVTPRTGFEGGGTQPPAPALNPAFSETRSPVSHPDYGQASVAQQLEPWQETEEKPATPVTATEFESEQIQETGQVPATERMEYASGYPVNFCPQCGNRVGAADRSCPNCGYSLNFDSLAAS